MKNTNPALKRVQFDLPEKSVHRLDAIKAKTEAASYSEVLRNALRLYEAVLAQAEAGNSFLIRDAQGKVSQYEIF